MSEALNTALNMPLEERINRWIRLIDQIQDSDIDKWTFNCINAIENAVF